MGRMWMTGLCLALTLPVYAQQAQVVPVDPPQTVSMPTGVGTDGIRTEQTLIVTGDQPGPGLWLVRKDGHDLWILAMLSPLPKDMQWQSKQVKDVIANAQEVIRAPQIVLTVDGGFFQKLMLVPSMMRARKNPDGKTLQQVVPPQSYERWTSLKARYMGHDNSVETWRPMFAAQELYGDAMKKSGLNGKNIVAAVVNDAIEAHHPKVTVVKEEIVVTDPKPLIKEFNRTTLDDLACFNSTMTSIETDLDAMRARANAWATGDMAALQSLPPAHSWEACESAFTEAGIGKRLGFGDAQKKMEAKWMASAESALSKNTVTFATLNLKDMVGPNSYLAKLKAKGYTVLAPDE